MTMATTTSGARSGSPGSDFAQLSKKIADAGLMGRRPGYYTLRITAVTGLYATGSAALRPRRRLVVDPGDRRLPGRHARPSRPGRP
ncbi:hypothetical protein SVIOM342S_03289 [Streptomyces violaceorubidus]